MNRKANVADSALEGRTTGARWLWIVTFVFLGGFGLWYVPAGPSPTADDYGQYLLHAQALADGRPYEDTGYLFSHFQWGTGPPVQSPGLPATLAPVLATVGYGSWIDEAVPLGFLALFMIAAGLYFARYDPVAAPLAVLLSGSALLFGHATITLGPDLGLCAFLWCAFLLADGEGSWGWGRTLLIGFLALAAVLYRVAALPLIPALLLFAAVRWRDHGWKPLIPFAVSAAGFWWVFRVFGAGAIPPPPDFIVEMVRTVQGPEPSFLRERLSTTYWNLRAYMMGTFELELYPWPWKVANQAYHVLVSPILALGIVVWLLGRWRTLGAIFFLGYVGMLTLVPLRHPRYLWPLYPALAYGLAVGIPWLLCRVRVSERRAQAVAVATVLTVVAAGGWRALVTPMPVAMKDRPEVREVMSYLVAARSREPDVRVSYYQPRMFVWHTGIPAMPLTSSPDPMMLMKELDAQNITHVVVGTMDGEFERAVDQWRELTAERPESFRRVLQNDVFAVYEVLPTGPA